MKKLVHLIGTVAIVVTMVFAGQAVYAAVVAPVAWPICSVVAAGADPTGTNNSWQAFTDAITCSVNNNYTPVHIPPGNYRLDAAIILLDSVSMIGHEPVSFLGDNNWQSSPIASSKAMPVRLIFPSTSGGIEMKQRTALAGVHIVFRNATGHQVAQDSFRAAINVTGNAVQISNVKIDAPGTGIRASDTVDAGRLLVDNVFIIGPRTTGVYVGRTADVARLMNVHIWEGAASAVSGTTGFILKNNDFMIVENLSVYNLETCFNFETLSGGAQVISAANLVSDFCHVGIKVSGNNELAITGGTQYTHFKGIEVTGASPYVPKVTVTGVQIKTNGDTPVVMNAPLGTLTLTGSRLERTASSPAVAMVAAKHFTLTGNTIIAPGTGVSFSAAPTRGAVVGNIIDASPQWGGTTTGVTIQAND